MTEEALGIVGQKSLSYMVDCRFHRDLQEEATEAREKARFNLVSLKKAGCRLNAIPSGNCGLHLKGREFGVMMHYCLGL